MIKFLVTAAIVLVCLFILVLVSCLMVWVVMRLLRWLFPQRFGGKAAPVKKSHSKKCYYDKTLKRLVPIEEDE